jgi:outer membrane immunogenic protein
VTESSRSFAECGAQVRIALRRVTNADVHFRRVRHGNRLSVLLALATLPALTGAALAADIPRPVVVAPAAPPPIVRVVPFSWTGHYIGIQGGYDWNHVVNTSDPAEDIKGDLNGPIAGIYGGANWQTGRIVFGVDASINADWARGDITAAGVFAGTGEVDWKAFVRGRLGVALGERLLLYATLGGSAADLKPIFPDGTVQGDPSAWGWTAGGGVEWAHRDHLTMRLDYAFTDYGDYRYSNGAVGTNSSHTLMFGIAWKK